MRFCRWTPAAVIFEVKHGGYQPVAAGDYVSWAPAEGEAGTFELMEWYRQAQVGDGGHIRSL